MTLLNEAKVEGYLLEAKLVKVNFGRKWKLAQGKYDFSDVCSKLTTSRCASINVNGRSDHNYLWRFFFRNLVISLSPMAFTQMPKFWRLIDMWHQCDSLWCVFRFIHIYSYFIGKESIIDILWVFLIKQSFHPPPSGYGMISWPTRQGTLLDLLNLFIFVEVGQNIYNEY